ncbi:hypothetical protein [Marinobacter sp. X15-166B]|uniref:hypothetical protein n=1 Tax=Marinobacter sp. X15-166B TaxID=1897620 RepID=UPI00085BC9DC|nr:hypothetical protein [Marinobacter sp. X15-166B]OEY65804.1 hypothetical protein BG841_04610 [Marinobacter sp. X15-166B]
MKNDCHYHPAVPAKWHCSHCQTYYCQRCMPDGDTKKQRGICPGCDHPLRYLGAATEVVPFWNRLSAFFRYPLHLDPLLVIGICTLVPLLISASLIGLIVSLLLFVALLKYTYAVIRHTAEGHMTPPPLATAFSGSGFNIVLLQLLVFVAMGGLVFAAGLIGGPLLALLMLAFVLLALPASIMILAMEHSVGAAINPMNLASLMARIGWPYFLMYGYLILLSLASGAAQEFAFQHFTPWLAQPFSGFLNSTFTLMLFHLLGYVVFQFQEELGFASDLQDGDAPVAMAQRDRSKRLDADLDIHLKDGNYDKVQALLVAALKHEPANSERTGQLYALLTARNNNEELYRYHPRILTWLAERRNGAGIADLLSRLAAVDPRFRLDDDGLILACGSALDQAGEFKAALKLLRDFHKRFPDSEHLAGAYILAAQILANRLQQWDKATAFLNFVNQHCPGSPQHPHLADYLQQAKNREPLKGPRANFMTDS